MDLLDQLGLEVLLGATLLLLGTLSSLVAFRFGAPLLLVFLALGMLAGEDGPGGIAFNDYRLAYQIGSVALAVILFDGGLRTRWSSLRTAAWPAGLLATLGVMITAWVTALFARQLFTLSWLEALLLGAVVASTDAAAVFFLLKVGGMQLRRRVTSTLEVESGSNDPLAFILTLVLVAAIAGGGEVSGLGVALAVLQQIVVGLLVGGLGGAALVYLLARAPLPTALLPLATLSGALVVYAGTGALGGSGFLAVYVAGIWVGARNTRAQPSILALFDMVTWMMQITMFVVLGLLVSPSHLLQHLVAALLLALALIFVARPVAVLLCLAPFRYHWREHVFISWVGLRGAVAIFLASIPMLAGLPGAELYFDVAFVVVCTSLVLQAWTVRPVARWMRQLLPTRDPDVRRVEIDLPGQSALELVSYSVPAHSPVLELARFPAGVRPILVARGDAVLGFESAGALAAGDHVLLLAPPSEVRSLDRLFAVSEEQIEAYARSKRGFVFPVATTLGALADFYGIKVSRRRRAQTLLEAFTEAYGEELAVGDELRVGEATLTVAATVQGRPSFVRLSVDPQRNE